jgi:hypothetical protein
MGGCLLRAQIIDMKNPRKYLTAVNQNGQYYEWLERTIHVDYPVNNRPIFEEWLSKQYFNVETDRILLPVFWTAYHVNNQYGKDAEKLSALQSFIDGLPRSDKYWTVCQYDDSVLIDFKDLDVMRFEMSKNIGTPIPLMCQPQPFKFGTPKKYIASFIGSRTHPVRNELERFRHRSQWYVSFEPHSIEEYCRIMHESIFALCPRGYGANSFRISEAIQYGAIPVYISDEFIEPFGIDFSSIGVKVLSHDTDHLTMLDDAPLEMMARAADLPAIYKKYYTYEGCLNEICNVLQAEYNSRQ